MIPQPLIDAPFVIQLHVASAALALLLGPVALFRTRRDKLHKTAGYVWILAFGVLAISGLFIPSGSFAVIGMFGPIHLLSLYAIAGLIEGLFRIRRGDVAAHRRTMRSLWFGAMGLAGLFTLVPGRLMNELLLNGNARAGWASLAIGLVGLLWLWRVRAGRLSLMP